MGAARSRYSVVLVGLDGAGKTTFLFNLAAKPSESSPTVGYNYHVIEQVYNRTKFQFHIFDLAGKLYLRPLWRHFYKSLRPNVVLFVVDATDRARLPEAKAELHKVLHEVDLLDAEVIILDNIKRTSSQVRTATPQHRSGTDPSAFTSRNLPRTNVEPLKESDIRYEMDVPREVSVLEVNANEPAELGRLMHQICQQLIKMK